MSGQVYSVPFAQIPEWVLDADISDRAVRVFCTLHRYANSDGYAFPGRTTLAERLHCSTPSLDRALNELRTIGAVISVQKKVGPAIVGNDYYLWPATPSSRVSTPSVTGEPTPSVTTDATVDSRVTRLEEREPSNESQRNESQSLALVTDDAFDQFWQAYPRKTDKGHARKAFAKALKLAAPHVIIEGARRYASDPNRDDRYTAYAATWLNGERWMDDPLPSRTRPTAQQVKRDASLDALGAFVAGPNRKAIDR